MEVILPNKIEHIEVSKLIPYIRNPRKHSEDQVIAVAESIKHFGFTSPILIKDDFTVLAGHCRILATKLLGLEKVPCIKLSHLTESQAKALVIADNQLALKSSWNNDLLKLELDDLEYEGFEIDLLGFEDLAFLELPETADGKEYDESCEKEVKFLVCPNCGEKIPK